MFPGCEFGLKHGYFMPYKVAAHDDGRSSCSRAAGESAWWLPPSFRHPEAPNEPDTMTVRFGTAVTVGQRRLDPLNTPVMQP